jgi:hypothetical protein
MILHFKAEQITKQGIYKDLFVDYRILGYPSSDSNGCRCIEVPDNYHTSSELLELVNNGIEVQQCPMFLLTTQTELDNFQASLEEPIIFDREHTVVEDKILVLLNTPGRHMEGSEWLQFIGMGEFKTLAEANVLLEPLNTI